MNTPEMQKVVAEVAKELLEKNKEIEYILVCFGDVPTIPAEELKRAVIAHLKGGKKFTLISSRKEDPFNYGRIVRYPRTALEIGAKTEEAVNSPQQQLTEKVRRGELVMVELPEVDTSLYGQWAKYLFLEGKEYQSLEGKIALYHPRRKCLADGVISLTREEVEKRRVRLKEKETILWDPRSGDFCDVKEQGDIGKTSGERREKDSLKVEGIDYPLSTGYLHSLKERNTGLVVMNREVLLKTIRDIDLGNLTCGKTGSGDKDVYALERHGDGEYYLPEIGKELIKKGERIELHSLGEGMGEGYDFRTDTREGAILENEQFIDKLRQRNVEVKPGTRFWLGREFDYRNIGSGVTFQGQIVLQGDIRIGSGAFLKDTEIWNYSYREYDSEERKRMIRESRRGLDFLNIGENCQIEESLIVNLNIDKEAKIKYCEIVGVDVREKEEMENKRVKIGGNGEILRIPRDPRPRIPSFAHLERLESEELKMLEHVYADSIRPGSEICADRTIKEYLKVLAGIVEEFGGAKSFCKKYIKELKTKTLEEIPGLEKFADLDFYLGANIVFNGMVGLEGKVYIDGWATIYNSLVKESRIGRNARISCSLVEKSSIESTPRAIAIVDNQVIKRGQATFLKEDIRTKCSTDAGMTHLRGAAWSRPEG